MLTKKYKQHPLAVRRFLITSAFVSLIASAAPAFGALTVNVQPMAMEGRGGHWAEPGRDFQWILGYYAWGTAKQATAEGGRAIGIFSLSEQSAPLVAGSTYDAALLPAGASPGRRGVTAATALLIEGYATGRLSQWNPSFSYDELSLVRLQAAIHAVEKTNPAAVPDDLYRFVLAHFGTWQLALQPYDGSIIRILALTPQGLGGPANDHLVYLPDNPVDHNRGLSGGFAGNEEGASTQPGGFIPPVTPRQGLLTDDQFQELTEEFVITFPKQGDDFFSFTPPEPPIIPHSDPPFTPGENPNTTGGYTPSEPKKVPDGGLTLTMILSAIALMAWSKRRR